MNDLDRLRAEERQAWDEFNSYVLAVSEMRKNASKPRIGKAYVSAAASMEEELIEKMKAWELARDQVTRFQRPAPIPQRDSLTYRGKNGSRRVEA
jgi:hypothetical protein